MSNCTVTGISVREYHNSVAKRTVYTVRTDAGREHDVDACHLDVRDRRVWIGDRGLLTYQPTANGMAYILTVRPEMQAAERSVAG